MTADGKISASDTITMEELQEAFAKSYGAVIGQLTLQNLALEKQVKHLKEYFSIQRDEIEALKEEIARLTEAGPTANHIAAQGNAIVAEARITT